LQNNSITSDDISEAMTDAVGKIRVYTTVEDYRRADRNYTEIESYNNL